MKLLKLFSLFFLFISINNYSQVKIGDSIVGSAGDEAGHSVDISSGGDIVIIGYPLADSDNGSASGIVRVFKYDSDNEQWNQLGSDIVGDAANDQFGFDVEITMYGDTPVIAASAPLNDNAFSNAGHVKVFIYNEENDAWDQIGETVEGDAESDYMGMSIDFANNHLSLTGLLAIGSPYNDDTATNAGQVKVYRVDYANQSLNKFGSDILGDNNGDYFGNSLSVAPAANIIAVGAPITMIMETMLVK